VITTEEGIARAAQTLGNRTFDAGKLRELIEGKLVDALHGDRRVDVREFSIPKEHADSEKSA
jgi:predicted DNA-binding protein (UPF0278 family)